MYTGDNIKALGEALANRNDSSVYYIPNSVVQSWKIIPPSPINPALNKVIHRLNSLGSLFYFAKVILNKNRFQISADPAKSLHYQMCRVVEKDGLKEVIEIPRDHFKSSTYSECFPVWRALPFTNEDESYMRKLGYGDEFILWMRRCHVQDNRILLVSEIITNAKKLGVKIRSHYEGNSLFKYLFPEIIPDKQETWTDDSLHQRRTVEGRIHGEGTFDFIGVGSALQSRHYDIIIQDDLVGREAVNSDTVMKKTIEYHQLLVGAMDTQAGRDCDELVVGNRWGYNDLNSYIRANEQYFRFNTHSALGGCCDLHPYGVPIFPESFSVELLERWRKRLGSYMFSCQFLNVPINPNEVKFKLSNLKYYEFIRDTDFSYTDNSTMGGGKRRYKIKIRHHVSEGDVVADLAPKNLKRYMIVDPNHSGEDGRCRHAITITGVAENPRRVYLLDVWAKACGFDEFIETMFFLATKVWKINTIHLETIAAQKYLKYHLDYHLKVKAGEHPEYRNIKIAELKTPRTKDAKKIRIDSLGPMFERGEIWINHVGMDEFKEEYETYPSGALRDVLDTLAYGPQVWGFNTDDVEVEEEIAQRRQLYLRSVRNLTTGY